MQQAPKGEGRHLNQQPVCGSSEVVSGWPETGPERVLTVAVPSEKQYMLGLKLGGGRPSPRFRARSALECSALRRRL